MLHIARAMNQLNFSALMEVYEEGNRENGEDLWPELSEGLRLLNAEQVEMKLGSRNPSKVGAIGGSQIIVEYGNDTHRGGVRIFGLWIGSAKAAQEKGIILKVAESIEGDVLNLEGVETPLVVGKDVRIGDGCRIGTVKKAYTGKGIVPLSADKTFRNALLCQRQCVNANALQLFAHLVNELYIGNAV